MQSFRCVAAIAAVAGLAAGTAYAQTAEGWRGEARLATPAAAPREAVIAGATWRCEGDECAGSAARKGNLDGLVRECRKVVAVIGPVSSYRSGARELSDGQLRACNRGSARMQTAGN
jgi:hypothetical protein